MNQLFANRGREESVDIHRARYEYVHVRSTAAVLAAVGPVNTYRFFAVQSAPCNLERLFGS